MINKNTPLEKYLRKRRFEKAIPYIIDSDFTNKDGRISVLDFGGNKGELGKVIGGRTLVDYVTGKEVYVEYDYCNELPKHNKKYNVIVALAVIEHMEIEEAFKTFKSLVENNLEDDGIIIITSPTRRVKPIIELLAFLRLIDRENIQEHKYYWVTKDFRELFDYIGVYGRHDTYFECGCNTLMIAQKRKVKI